MRDAKSETKRHKATEQNDATTTATPTWPRESEILNKHETDWLFCWQIFRCIDSGSFFFEGCKRARCARRIFEISTWFYFFPFLYFVWGARSRPHLLKRARPNQSIEILYLFSLFLFVCFVYPGVNKWVVFIQKASKHSLLGLCFPLTFASSKWTLREKFTFWRFFFSS